MEEPIDINIKKTRRKGFKSRRKKSGTNFKSFQVNFDDHKVHLMRNRFIYTSFSYGQIEFIEFSKGKLLKNVLVIRIACVAVIAILIYFMVQTTKVNISQKEFDLSLVFNKGALLAIWGPVILIVFCVRGIIQSYLKSTIIHIITDSKEYTARIKEIDKRGETKDLIRFLLDKKVSLRRAN
ncbi:MAG: hypothetical protein JKY54_14090 [Flavobacteriales bacterium]|nr:hypothetical protein [Flavobacteriales bacterium]